MLARKMISVLFSTQGSDQLLNQTRRCLRFMRLERRFMLSGDFGDSFEVDDDDLDELDEIEIGDFRSSDDYDDDDDRENDSSDDHDEDDDLEHHVTIVSPTQVDTLVNSIIRTPVETADQPIDETDQELESDLDAELGDEPATSEPPSNISTTPEGESVDETFARLSNFLRASEPGSTRSVAEDITPEVQSPVSNQAGHVVESPASSPSHGLDSLYVPDSQHSRDAIQLIPTRLDPVELANHSVHEIEPSEQLPVAHHLPDVATPQQDETLGAAAIEWLGSFADELSVLDEALSQLIGDRSASNSWSVANLFQHGPVVAAGLITTGVASTVIQRKRRQQSPIEDDHYCVRFDVRQYPEVFG